MESSPTQAARSRSPQRRPKGPIRWSAVVGKVAVYSMLVTGAAVFSFPFLWMAATSVKVDRELQTRDLKILPLTPHARQRSPYIDTTYYDDIEGPHQEQLLPALEKIAKHSGFEIPAEVNRDIARQQIARGLYGQMRARLPAKLWQSTADGAAERLIAAARKEADADMVAAAFGSVYRRLTIGGIRLRSYDRQEAELGADPGGNTPISQRLDNHTPGVATLLDLPPDPHPLALVRYDFADKDRIVLSRTYDVPEEFDLARLHRIQMEIRPDDTWHELWLTVEMNGQTFRAARAFPLGNFEVATASWQPAGPDDNSTKIKSWTRLVNVEEPSSLNNPRKIKLTLEVRRSSKAGAWWVKIRNNYSKVLDHMPFWRYVRVSLFLVIIKILLAVIFSSLVAYAFARLNWPGREFCFILMLATMMIPHQVLMIPQFLIWKHLGAYNTLTPLWLGPAFGNAFFVFLLRQFLKGIPRDLEDAARIDGCSFLGIYWHIMLPLIKPSLAAIAIFTFMGTWNDFMGPLIYIADQRLYPLAFGLYAFSVQVGNDPALTMAASLLMTVPVIVIFFLAQKHFIQGVTLTGMKQ